ncbi:MAG: TIGR03560 family F420-dependent LLM class oxidoreductase [Candidatus Hermodarchaeota archaeon]
MKIGFGIHIAPQMGFDYQAVESITLNVERLGYNLVTLGDHLFLDEKSEELNCMETWTLLSALAARTSKIRLGPLVTCNSFRHPSVLAKIAATVDLISKGRLIFGIGAGWKQIEYDAYGIRFPSVSERMDQLEEAIQIIRKLWTEPKATFEGKHYRITNAPCAPKPIQKPYPPLLIGGAGEKRILRMVAKYANMSNFTWQEGSKVDRLLGILRKHCEAVGRDYNSIEKTFLAICFISEDEDEIETRIVETAKRRGISLEQQKKEVSSEPGILYGTPEEVRERCQSLINKGITQFQIRFSEEKELQMSTLFAKSVKDQLQS